MTTRVFLGTAYGCLPVRSRGQADSSGGRWPLTSAHAACG